MDPDSAYINRDRIVLKVCQLQESLIDLNKTTQWQLSEKQRILQGEITDYQGGLSSMDQISSFFKYTIADALDVKITT